MGAVPPFVVRDGSCHAILALDVGREIDVERAAAALGAAPSPPAGTGRPPYLQFARPPVRCALPVTPLAIDEVRTAPEAHLVLYEFGAAAVVFTVPVEGSLADLARLGSRLSATE